MRVEQAQYLLALISIFDRARTEPGLVAAIRNIFDQYDSQTLGDHKGPFQSLELINDRIRLSSLIYNHHNRGGFPELVPHAQFLEQLDEDISDIIDNRCMAIMTVTEDDWVISRAALKILQANNIGFMIDNDTELFRAVGHEVETVDYICDEFAL